MRPVRSLLGALLFEVSAAEPTIYAAAISLALLATSAMLPAAIRVARRSVDRLRAE